MAKANNTKNENNDKNLEQVLAEIEKQFGKGSIMKLGENPHMNVEVTSSGSIRLRINSSISLAYAKLFFHPAVVI